MSEQFNESDFHKIAPLNYHGTSGTFDTLLSHFQA
jgi:hypothetical protein